MFKDIIKPITKSPQMPQILQELNKMWNDEQKRRNEFYDWVSPDVKAEFIEGTIIVHSPVRSRHSQVLKFIIKFLDEFIEENKLGSIGYESNMCRFPRNDYEPDFCFFDKHTSKIINDDTTIFPIPQMIIEVVSPSTEHLDRGVKFTDFAANGVKEYWIVDGTTDTIEQFILRDNEYFLEKKHDVKSIIASPVLTGLSVSADIFFDKTANRAAIKNLR